MEEEMQTIEGFDIYYENDERVGDLKSIAGAMAEFKLLPLERWCSMQRIKRVPVKNNILTSGILCFRMYDDLPLESTSFTSAWVK